MERSCSCAEPQILSAEACMFVFSPKPVFRAFYSPSFLTHSSHGLWQTFLTPKSLSANKINALIKLCLKTDTTSMRNVLIDKYLKLHHPWNALIFFSAAHCRMKNQCCRQSFYSMRP